VIFGIVGFENPGSLPTAPTSARIRGHNTDFLGNKISGDYHVTQRGMRSMSLFRNADEGHAYPLFIGQKLAPFVAKIGKAGRPIKREHQNWYYVPRFMKDFVFGPAL